MSYKENVQDDLRAQASVDDAASLDGHCFDSPINLEGGSSSERLAIAGGDLVVTGSHPPRVLRSWPLGELSGFRVEPLVGSSVLQARLHEDWVDLLRVPGAPGQELEELVSRLNLHRRRPGLARAASDVGAGASTRGAGIGRRLLVLLRPFRGRLVILLLLSVGAIVVELAPPMLQKILVDRVLRAPAAAGRAGQLSLLLLAIVAGLLLIRLAAVAVAIIKGWISSRVGTTLTANLRDQLVRKLNALPLAFHDRHQVGALMSRAAYDTETLHTLVYHLTGGFLLQILQLVGIGVALVWLNPRLALVAMLPMPFIVVGSWYFTRYLNPRHSHYWEAVGRQASALSGMLSGIRVVKSFAQEDRENSRFQTFSRRLRDSRQTVDVSTSTFVAVIGLIFALGVLAAWYVGGRDVLLGGMTLGSLMAFLQYLAMFYAPLTTIGESTTWISSFTTAMRRVFELISASGEAEEAAPRGARIHSVAGRLEFQEVCFGYDKSRPVLEDISFAVRPGEMVGVVGRSGSGKSTMVSLIGRLYRPDAGRILLDGVDIRELKVRELRRSIGVVPQEPFLFRGTVAENISYGDPELAPEDLLDAAVCADAHAFIIRLPLGYDTQLEEAGSGLSGGERQRLSIARALAFDPVILILDEATGSVDAESEQAICRAIRRFARHRTTIAIAHRLSTLRDADRLLVLDQGRLVEQGTPEELLARGGLFSTLASLQRTMTEGRRRFETASGGGASPTALAELSGESALVESCALDQAAAAPGDPARREIDRAGPMWLEPGEVVIADDDAGGLRVRQDGAWHRAQATLAFPALAQDRYLSLQRREAAGRVVELGMIRELAGWPGEAQALLRRALGRRYLLHRVREIQQIRTQGLRVVMQVLTEAGPARLQLDKLNEGFRSFGPNGLLMVDGDGSYYLIPDRQALPSRQRRLLSLYLGD